MRLIANPEEKTPAHITVRGPYSRRVNRSAVARMAERVKETVVEASGFGTFSCDGQNTVFLRCHSERLREIWRKKDYGYCPHITIYDGASRSFASQLFSRLKKLEVQESFRITGLQPLETRSGQRSMLLRQEFDEQFVSTVLGQVVAARDLDGLSADRRVDLLETLARELAAEGSESGSRRRGMGERDHEGAGLAVSDHWPSAANAIQ